jgi:hypothetical protein
MKKYTVYISYTESGSVEVEAENEKEAEEKAYKAIDDGEVHMDNQHDEPIYEYEVEEIPDDK